MNCQNFKQTEIGIIPEDWDVVELGDIGKVSMCKRIFKHETNISEGIPFYKIKTFGKRADAFISKEIFNKYKERYPYPQKGDILLSTSGTIGRTLIFDGKPAYFQDSNIVWLNHNGAKVDNKFLFYCYQKTNWITEGSTIKRLYNNLLLSTKIPLPPLSEQRSIAEVLSSLDEKIKLNNKINKILEEVGQIIFKKYFIDEEKKSWETSDLKEQLKTVLGGTPSRLKKEYWGGNINWINSGKVNEFRIIEPSEMITQEGLSKSATTLLPAGSPVIAITGATLGQVSRLEINSCANQSVIGILENEKFSSPYIYYWTKNNIKEITGHQTGGAQQHINKGNVDDYPFVVPEDRILKEFNNLIQPIFQKISSNCFQNKALLQIRDTLLPKLISGEIRVK